MPEWIRTWKARLIFRYEISDLFHICAPSPPLCAFIFFCHITVYTFHLQYDLYFFFVDEIGGFAHLLLKVILSLCGIWNLDSFRPIVDPFRISPNIKNLVMHLHWRPLSSYSLHTFVLSSMIITSDQLFCSRNLFTGVLCISEGTGILRVLSSILLPPSFFFLLQKYFCIL